MFNRLATATAVSILLSAGAFAQTSTEATSGASSGAGMTTLPSAWDETITGAFFSEGENPTLVEEQEMTTNWEALSDEQQATVRSHCATVDTAAAGTGAAGTATTGTSGATGCDETAAAGTDTTTTTTTTPDASATTDSETTASTTPDTSTSTSGSADASMQVAEADIQELCTRIMDMN